MPFLKLKCFLRRCLRHFWPGCCHSFPSADLARVICLMGFFSLEFSDSAVAHPHMRGRVRVRARPQLF